MKVWTAFNWIMVSPVVDCCEHVKEPSGVIKGRQFLGQMSDYELPKRDSDPWNYLVGLHYIFVKYMVCNLCHLTSHHWKSRIKRKHCVYLTLNEQNDLLIMLQTTWKKENISKGYKNGNYSFIPDEFAKQVLT